MARFLIVFACPVLWALLIVGTKYTLSLGEDPVTLLFWSACLPLVFWLAQLGIRRADIARLRAPEWWLVAAIAVVGSASMLFETLALQYGSAAGYALLVRTSMLFTFAFAFIILGERLERAKWPAAGLLLLGAALVVTDGRMPSFAPGDLLAIGAAATVALGNTVLGKKLTATVPSVTAAALTSVAGIVPIAALTLYSDALRLPEHPVLVALLGGLVLLGVLARFRAYAHASAGYISMMFSFTPVIVAAISTVLLHERLSAAELAGGALVVAAGVWAARIHR